MTNKITRASIREMLALNETTNLGFRGAEGSPGGYLQQNDAIQSVSGVRSVTIDGQPFSDIWSELQRQTTQFNQFASAMISVLTYQVTRAQDRVGVYTIPEFEEATEYDTPNKVALDYVFRGYPLRYFDLGIGFTRMFLDSAQGQEILSQQRSVENGWWNLQRRTVLRALFSASNATVEGVSVKRLYNADGEIPPRYATYTHDGNHTHYLSSGNSSPTAANVSTLEEHLLHHGYGDNGEEMALHVPRNLITAVRALTGYVPAQSSNRPVIVDGRVVGQTSSSMVEGLGINVDGYIGRFAVIENVGIPASYLLAQATGGANAMQNPVGFRVHENAAARGLRLHAGSFQEQPLIDSVYDTYMGAGVRHRGAAVVMFVDAGAYTAPTIT